MDRDRDENAMHLAQFRNTSNHAALEAFEANQTDADGYVRRFSETMRKVPTPIARQGEYGTIVESVEGQDLWAITARREAAQKQALKYNAMESANTFIRNGIRIVDGSLQSLDPSVEMHENFTNAAGTLMATAADGIETVRQFFRKIWSRGKWAPDAE
jgi:hypothetical protein